MEKPVKKSPNKKTIDNLFVREYKGSGILGNWAVNASLIGRSSNSLERRDGNGGIGQTQGSTGSRDNKTKAVLEKFIIF